MNDFPRSFFFLYYAYLHFSSYFPIFPIFLFFQFVFSFWSFKLKKYMLIKFQIKWCIWWVFVSRLSGDIYSFSTSSIFKSIGCGCVSFSTFWSFSLSFLMKSVFGRFLQLLCCLNGKVVQCWRIFEVVNSINANSE